MMKHRIWELDAARGIFILGMVIVHLLYDLNTPAVESTWLYQLALNRGAILFILLSGVCSSLSRRPIRRGLMVFGGGVICSLATLSLHRLGFAPKSIIIYFGILHCLGVCMLLGAITKKLPTLLILSLGIILIAANQWLQKQGFSGNWYTMPLGFPPKAFSTADYFPLLPNFGYFLIGSAIGKYVYREKSTRFPNVNTRSPLIAALTFSGRHTLTIYLLHQPVILILLLIF